MDILLKAWTRVSKEITGASCRSSVVDLSKESLGKYLTQWLRPECLFYRNRRCRGQIFGKFGPFCIAFENGGLSNALLEAMSYGIPASPPMWEGPRKSLGWKNHGMIPCGNLLDCRIWNHDTAGGCRRPLERYALFNAE